MPDYTGKTIYVGIDVHKDSYSVTVLCDGDLIKRDKILAVPEILLEYIKKFKGANVKSAYEAGFSGFYLHRFLISKGISNIVVHAASIEISSRDSVKTDKRDSLKIATQLAANRLSCVYIPTEEREDKRNLTRLREQFVRHRNRVACQIKSLLHLHGMIKPKSNPRVGDRWIKSIFEIPMRKNLKFSIEKLYWSWSYQNMQIGLINKEIASEVKEDLELETIYCSIPGIGPTSARKLINELDDMSQFSNEDKLFSYVGLTPREYSSGEHIRQGHITKQGKPLIRCILVEAAWMCIRKDSSLAILYEKLWKRVGKKRAIVAIARNMLGRLRT
jgi:transposase